MSEQLDPGFYHRVEAVMNLCNAQEPQAAGDRVAMSAAFAAARYEAWMCARLFKDAQTMAERRDEAERVYVEEFRTMFRANVDDFLANWDKLMTEMPQPADSGGR